MCELARPAGPRRRASIMDSILYEFDPSEPMRLWAYTDALHRPTHTTDARVSVRYRHSTTWIITVHAARRRPDMTQRQTQYAPQRCYALPSSITLDGTPAPHAMYPIQSIQCRSCLYNTVYGPCLYEREMNWGTAL